MQQTSADNRRAGKSAPSGLPRSRDGPSSPASRTAHLSAVPTPTSSPRLPSNTTRRTPVARSDQEPPASANRRTCEPVPSAGDHHQRAVTGSGTIGPHGSIHTGAYPQHNGTPRHADARQISAQNKERKSATALRSTIRCLERTIAHNSSPGGAIAASQPTMWPPRGRRPRCPSTGGPERSQPMGQRCRRVRS